MGASYITQCCLLFFYYRGFTMGVWHKFKAKPVKYENSTFSSKLEFDYFLHLNLLQKGGEIIFFLRQVPLHLPGGTKYVCDFVTFDKMGEVHFIDVKGVETDTFKIKKREIEAVYPFEIKLVKRGDF